MAVIARRFSKRRIGVAMLWALQAGLTLSTAAAAYAQTMPAGPVPQAALEHRDVERDQTKMVGLLLPAFSGSSASDTLTTFLFKEQVRLRLNRIDAGRALGFSQSYLIDAPLADASHAGAVRLARQNGFQGVVWGAVADYAYKDDFEGVAIFPNFSWSGQYEDFRTLPGQSDRRLEIWMVSYKGQTVSASPPSDFVPLPPYLISQQLRARLADGTICARPSTGGNCVPISELEPNRAIAIDSRSGQVTYRAFDGATEYRVTLPPEIFADQSAVDYVAMFFNYARGHWSNTIRLAAEVEAADASSSQMVHDALLYRAAALFRSGQDGSAPLAKARMDYPFSPTVSQYLVLAAMVRLKAGQITTADFETIVTEERARIGDTWFDANGFSRPAISGSQMQREALFHRATPQAKHGGAAPAETGANQVFSRTADTYPALAAIAQPELGQTHAK